MRKIYPLALCLLLGVMLAGAADIVTLQAADCSATSGWRLTKLHGKVGSSAFEPGASLPQGAPVAKGLKLAYDFTRAPGYVGVGWSGTPWPGKPRRIVFWLYAQKVPHPFVLRLRDAKGQYFQRTVLDLAKVQGWQKVEVDLSDCSGWAHFGGPNDGKVTYPLALAELIVDKEQPADKGVVYFAQLQVTTEVTGKDALTLELARTPKAPFMVGLKQAAFEARLHNYLGRPLQLQVDCTVQALAGASQHWDKTQSVKVPAKGELTVSFAFTPPAFGVYLCSVKVKGSDWARTAETRLACTDDPTPCGLVQDSPWGMGIYLKRFGLDELDEATGLAQAAGIKWAREEFSWSQLQLDEHTWDFSRFDKHVDAYYEHGIEVMGLLDYWNQVTVPFTRKGYNDYAEYCNRVVSRYKDRIKYWEVWNEPNIRPFWTGKPEQYSDLLITAAKAIKAADPDAHIVAFCTSRTDTKFISERLKEGTLGSFDIISVHPYRYPSTPESSDLVGELQRAFQLFLQLGAPKHKVWITEIGWPTHEGTSGSSELKEAQMLVRTYLLSLYSGTVSKVFWYNYRNDGFDKHYNEHNFGILAKPFEPKCAYLAYKTMTERLGPAPQFVKRLEGKDPDDYVLEFADKDRAVFVCWRNGAPKAAALELGTNLMRAWDIFGNSLQVRAVSGVLKLNLGPSPIYVETLNRTLHSRLVDDWLEAAVVPAKASPGDLVTVEARINNPTLHKLKGKVTFKSPFDGATATSAFEVPLQAHEVVKHTFRVPQSAVEGKFAFSETVKTRLDRDLKTASDLQVQFPLEFTVRASAVAGGHPVLLLQPDRPGLQASVTTIYAGEPVGEPQDFTFTSARAQGAELALPKAFDQSRQVQGELLLQVEGHGQVQREFSFASVPVPYLAGKTLKAPFVLGPDAWVPLKRGVYSGAADCSADFGFAWKEDGLYFLVKVRDDKVATASNAFDLWRGDSLQIGVCNRRPERSRPDEYFEFGVALIQGKPVLYLYHSPEDYKAADRLVQASKVKVERQGDYTIYEGKLALGKWLKPSPAKGCGLSFLVNDNDGAGREGWLEWGGGIGYHKDPALYGYAELGL